MRTMSQDVALSRLFEHLRYVRELAVKSITLAGEAARPPGHASRAEANAHAIDSVYRFAEDLEGRYTQRLSEHGPCDLPADEFSRVIHELASEMTRARVAEEALILGWKVEKGAAAHV